MKTNFDKMEEVFGINFANEIWNALDTAQDYGVMMMLKDPYYEEGEEHTISVSVEYDSIIPEGKVMYDLIRELEKELPWFIRLEELYNGNLVKYIGTITVIDSKVKND